MEQESGIMSILIKGVTMPKNCFDCPMAFAVDFGILCTPTHYIVGDNEISKKQGFCPLIPVPPHGRLIDADKLVDSFEPSDFWNSDAEDNCFAAVRIVHSAPTIIPAEPYKEKGE